MRWQFTMRDLLFAMFIACVCLVVMRFVASDPSLAIVLIPALVAFIAGLLQLRGNRDVARAVAAGSLGLILLPVVLILLAWVLFMVSGL